MNRYDVVIIGSGLGSLLCGYILSKEGFSICIIEKQAVPGGCLQSFRRGENSFDTGIHYIGSMLPGQTLHSYWKYFGLSHSLELERMNEDCFDMVSFEGMDINLAQGFDRFAGSLASQFPGSGNFLSSYVSALKETVSAFPLYNLELTDKMTKTTWMGTNAWEFLNTMAGEDEVNKILLQALSGNNFLYAGQKPATPWHQYALINHSFIGSSWRLKRGSGQIAELLVAGILSHGGKLLLRKEIRKISSLKNKFLIETSTQESFIAARVIAGIHPQKAISLLEPEMVRRSFRSRIMGMENTVSSFGLYLGLKPGSFPYIGHNIYYHCGRDVWAASEYTGEEWPGMYFLYTPVTARQSDLTSAANQGDHSSAANQGDHSSAVCILSYMKFDEVKRWENTMTGRRGSDYLFFKEERARKLLQVVERKFPGLRSLINNMEISTPLTWRDYTGTPEGSMYGIRKESGNYLRTMILPHTKIPGFYFTGQNLNMHGAPGVTIGAVMTCAEILGLEYLFNKIRNAG